MEVGERGPGGVFKQQSLTERDFEIQVKRFLVRKCVVVPRVEYLMNTRNREKIRHGESENLGEHCSQSVTTPRAGNSIKGIFLGSHPPSPKVLLLNVNVLCER